MKKRLIATVIILTVLFTLILLKQSDSKNSNYILVKEIKSPNSINELSCYGVMYNPISIRYYILSINDNKYLMFDADAIIYAEWESDDKLHIYCSKEPMEYFRGFGEFDIIIDKSFYKVLQFRASKRENEIKIVTI